MIKTNFTAMLLAVDQMLPNASLYSAGTSVANRPKSHGFYDQLLRDGAIHVPSLL